MLTCYTRSFFCACLFLLTGLYGCKKGCTNATALNYNQSARQDDASCLFCDSVVKGVYSVVSDESDYEGDAPYFYNDVLRLKIAGELKDFSGNYCEKMGLVSTCPNGSIRGFARLKISLQNLVADTMIVNGFVTLQVLGASRFISYNGHYQDLIIAPSATIIVADSIYIDCVQSDTAAISSLDKGFSFTYR